MTDRIPDFEVERLALGELDPQQARSLRARLQRDGDPRLAAIEASNAEILRDYPPEAMARRIGRRLEVAEAEAEPRRRWWWVPIAAAVAAAVLLVLAWPDAAPIAVQRSLDGEPIARNDATAGGREPTRLKGDARLRIVRQSDRGAEPLGAGAEVLAGDRLQLSYVSAGATHGVIVSADGAGVVTLHFPAEAAESTALQERGALDHSYELDDAPGFERFWLVTADAPIDVEAVLEAARTVATGPEATTAPLPLEPGLSQGSVLLHKAAQPMEAPGG